MLSIVFYTKRFFGNFFRRIKADLADETGIGVVEVILILLVLVGLVLIFRNQIISIAKTIFGNITNQAGDVQITEVE